MCGPIALSIPVHQYSEWKKNLGVLLYNLGRTFTYGLLGLIVGFIGQSLYFFKLQQYFSIIVGVVILLFILSNYWKIKFHFKKRMQFSFNKFLQSKLAFLLQKRKVQHLFLIGVLNGLLPCGMVYLALTAAAATGNFTSSTLFMLAFGIGTAPLMYAFISLGKFFSNTYRIFLQKSVPIMLALMAVLLIVRGLNLGIPYLSPQIETYKQIGNNNLKENQIIKCHVPAAIKKD
jgi:sulfite exporter TauE/SafE